MNLTASADGLFSLFLGLVLIPAACLASIMTVYWSAPCGSDNLLGRGARKTNPVAAASAAKSGTGKSVRGARNVHRGYAQNKAGPVTKSGQSQLGSGDSNAYTLGSSAQSAKGHAGRYNNLRQSKQAECATRRKKMLVGRHRRRKLGRNRRSRTQRDGLTVVTIHEYKH